MLDLARIKKRLEKITKKADAENLPTGIEIGDMFNSQRDELSEFIDRASREYPDSEKFKRDSLRIAKTAIGLRDLQRLKSARR